MKSSAAQLLFLIVFLFLSNIRAQQLVSGDSCNTTASCDTKAECAGSEYCDEDCKQVENIIAKGHIDSIEGWAIRHNSLAKLFASRQCKVVAEIGVAYATLTNYLLTKLPSITEYHGIDPFLGGYDENDAMSKTLLGYKPRTFANAVLEKLKTFECKFHMHFGLSGDVAKTFKNESIDCLFIDGDHTYHGVVEDIKNWLPLVRKGGSIIFDDYSHSYQGLVLAVDQFVDNNNLQFIKVNEHNNYYVALHSGPYAYNTSFEKFFDYGNSNDKNI